MEKYDFDAQPELRRDRIYVSWNEQWDLGRYAEHYLKDRNLVVDDSARELVLKQIALCRAEGGASQGGCRLLPRRECEACAREADDTGAGQATQPGVTRLYDAYADRPISCAAPLASPL